MTAWIDRELARAVKAEARLLALCETLTREGRTEEVLACLAGFTPRPEALEFTPRLRALLGERT